MDDVRNEQNGIPKEKGKKDKSRSGRTAKQAKKGGIIMNHTNGPGLIGIGRNYSRSGDTTIRIQTFRGLRERRSFVKETEGKRESPLRKKVKSHVTYQQRQRRLYQYRPLQCLHRE
jgi:hypothetical protein